MMKNKKLIYGIVLVCVIFILILSFGLYNHYKILKQEEANPIITIAKEHLQKYVPNASSDVDFFSMMKKAKVVEGECEANKYWENWGQPPIESPSKHPCWIVRFDYYDIGGYLEVYIDKNTNEVIGGMQTK